LWVVPNSQYEESTKRQKRVCPCCVVSIGVPLTPPPLPEFFIDNYDHWKDHYAAINEIFKKAVQAEINLWGTALHPQP
jgi:hypothetical protein